MPLPSDCQATSRTVSNSCQRSQRQSLAEALPFKPAPRPEIARCRRAIWSIFNGNALRARYFHIVRVAGSKIARCRSATVRTRATPGK
jgi:hypothetical protein